MRLDYLKKSTVIAVACLTIGLGSIVSLALAADEEAKPKHTIKEIMKIANSKDGLLAKIKAGNATAEEKTQLLDLYIDLLENKPPKGEMESWHNLAGAAVLAAAKVAVGREGSVAELEKATNCKACHTPHKGS